MRLTFDDSTMMAWRQGQLVRGEVLASDEKGSLIMVEGRPVAINKPLNAGQTFSAKVQIGSDGKPSLSIEGESIVSHLDDASEADDKRILQNWGLEPTEDNLALLRLLRKTIGSLSMGGGAAGSAGGGIASGFTLDALQALKNLLVRLGVGSKLDAISQHALEIMLRRHLPERAFPLLIKYLKGDMTFAHFMKNLPESWREAFAESWGEQPLFERLIELMQGASKDDALALQTAADELVANLALQELLSQTLASASEEHFYFQWPIFWQDSQIPDTLEGDAFYEKGNGPGRGFSLRLQLSPPRLGRLEIGLHRLNEALWIHFAAQEPTTIPALRTFFSDLQERLKNLGWRSIRLTAGRMPIRDHFFADATSGSSSDASDSNSHAHSHHLDVKV